MDDELQLAGEPDSVPRARRFVTSTLDGRVDAVVLADAELVVSELVTNALLHAGNPVRVVVGVDRDLVRLEVVDPSRRTLSRPIPSSSSMTGRGLSLVERLASAWGVEANAEGKTVWCELRSDPARGAATGPAVIPTLAAPRGDSVGAAEPTFRVTLGDVPTSLLLAAKEHTENIVREFSLAASGAASGESAGIPLEMANMVDTVIHGFSAPRAAIKAQALAAAQRGEDRTQLVLELTAGAADAGYAYLAALDHADTYARRAQILTLETPPQHRAFRRWYVGSLADQLRAAARGDTVSPRTFEQYLLEEIDSVAAAHAAAQRLASRLAHLQDLTAELTAVSDIHSVAEIVVDHAANAFGAVFAALYILEGDSLRAVGVHGSASTQMTSWSVVKLDAPLPVAEAVQRGAPVILRGRGELTGRYPALAAHPLADQSVACIPLMVGQRRLGVIALTFPLHRDLTDPDEIRFLGSLADACAQALDRAHALFEARETAAKLTFLADASAELATTLDPHKTLANIANLVVPRLADWCTVQIVEADAITNIAIAHVDPDKVAFAEELQRRYPTSPDSPTGVPQVVRTGVAELYREVTDEMLVASARDEEHLEVTRALGLRSAMIVPLTGSEGTFGAITMVQAESGRRYDQADLALATELAHRAGLAVQQAQVYDQQKGQLATITRIAETAQHAILAPVTGLVGPVTLAASYVSAASEALVGGDLYEVVSVRGHVRLLIGDVRGKGLDAVRLATVVLGFFRTAAVEERALSRLARQMDRRLLPYLGDEDFVTALIVQVSADGSCELVSCGHPGPLLARADSLTEVTCTPSRPLGLGADPEVGHLQLAVGDRLLLYTDGLVEARRADGSFVDLLDVAEPLRRGDLDRALRRILARLRAVTGSDLNDDLALLAAEYSPLPSSEHR